MEPFVLWIEGAHLAEETLVKRPIDERRRVKGNLKLLLCIV